MAYVKTIVCLANSYKTNGRCIAGKVVSKDGYGTWIRPMSDRPTEELSFFEYCYEGYASPDLLDTVDVPLLKAKPHNHQTENHVIQPGRWLKTGSFAWSRLDELRDRPEALWANTGRTRAGLNDCLSPQEIANFDFSLALVKREKLVVEVDTSTWDGKTKKTSRAKFRYKGVDYSLKITDPRANAAFKQKEVGEYILNDVFLCISLTEKYAGDGRCHKLVAAIFTNPPL
jgi:hypothetical protein